MYNDFSFQMILTKGTVNGTDTLLQMLPNLKKYSFIHLFSCKNSSNITPHYLNFPKIHPE